MNEEVMLVAYTDNDYEFVYEVKKNAYKKYVEECWGSWVDEDQRKYFEKFINTVKSNAFIIMDGDKKIGFYNEAIEKVSESRSYLGAVQNRLEHTINNLGTASENLSASESRIRDTDMATEMMNFTKQNILMQAAQSMLAQANQQPQGILQLLG